MQGSHATSPDFVPRRQILHLLCWHLQLLSPNLSLYPSGQPVRSTIWDQPAVYHNLGLADQYATPAVTKWSRRQIHFGSRFLHCFPL